MLFVHVGTINLQKVAAVKEEFSKVATVDRYDSAKVPSGVSEQPQGLEAVIQGARGRALNFPIPPTNDDVTHITVGLESGIVNETGRYPEVRFTMTCCAILCSRPVRPDDLRKGPSGSWIYGFSSGFTIPERILHHVRKGLDLSQATAKAGYTTHPKIGEGDGLIGLLSSGRVTRRDQLKEAVRNALFHLDTLL